MSDIELQTWVEQDTKGDYWVYLSSEMQKRLKKTVTELPEQRNEIK